MLNFTVDLVLTATIAPFTGGGDGASTGITVTVTSAEVNGLPGYSEVSRALAVRQGLTLVHLSAQLERFVWDRGCAEGWGDVARVKGVFGECRVLSCDNTTEVELKSGRV